MFISHAESAAKGFKKWSLAQKAARYETLNPEEPTPTDAAATAPAPVNGSEQTE